MPSLLNQHTSSHSYISTLNILIYRQHQQQHQHLFCVIKIVAFTCTIISFEFTSVTSYLFAFVLQILRNGRDLQGLGIDLQNPDRDAPAFPEDRKCYFSGNSEIEKTSSDATFSSQRAVTGSKQYNYSLLDLVPQPR